MKTRSLSYSFVRRSNSFHDWMYHLRHDDYWNLDASILNPLNVLQDDPNKQKRNRYPKNGRKGRA